MANKGKYVDRNPDIHAAGKIVDNDLNVGDTLLANYSLEEYAENVIKKKCKEQNEQCKKKGSVGYSTTLPVESLKEIMSPESKKSRFVTFREKFQESMFFKKPELGKPFSLQCKPEELNNENTTYGKASIRSESCYGLILPNKSPEQVNREYIKWHDKYIISHKHYLPSEKINRKYTDSFNPKATFGISTCVDQSGKLVKRCLQECDKLVVVNQMQKLFLERTRPTVGQRIDRFQLNVDPYTTFGKRSKAEECNVRALIEDIDPCVARQNIYAVLAYIHKLRRYIFNRINFHMFDLKSLMQKYDKDDTDYITFKSIFKAMNTLLIRPNEEKIRLAASLFKIIVDENLPTERVHLDKFWKILHIQYPLPYPTDTFRVPDNSVTKDTIYRLMCRDRKESPLPEERYPVKRILSDDDRTRVSDLISPEIPMNFGLGPRDFEILRPKDELKRIFRKILTDNFDKVWEAARSKINGEPDCKMSVNTLRGVMTEVKAEDDS